MARGRAAPGRPRGGERIPPARPSRARLGTAAAALAAAGALAAYPALSASRLEELLAGLGGGAVALLAIGLAGSFAAFVPWSLAVLAAAYAISLSAGGQAVDSRAPLYAAGLLLAAELAYWSLERRSPGRDEPGAIARRTAALLALVLGSVGLGALLLATVELPAGGGLVLEAAGVAAATATLALLAALARRPPPPAG